MSRSDLKNVLSAMSTIVNVRGYLPTTIPKNLEEELLYAFTLGPSLANTQPWELLLVTGLQERELVAAATLDPFLTTASFGGQAWLKNAPLVVLVLMEKRRAQVRLGERGELFAIQDTYSAIQNARLMAALHGISSSLIREFDPLVLQKNVQLPWYLEPIAILTFGYSEEEKELPPRLAVADICIERRCSSHDGDELSDSRDL